VIELHVDDVGHVARLIHVISLLRALKCSARVIVKVLHPTDVHLSKAATILKHLTDSVHFPRIHVAIVSGDADTALEVFNVSLDRHDIGGITANGYEIPVWHRDTVRTEHELHATMLSAILHCQSHVPDGVFSLWDMVGLYKRVSASPGSTPQLSQIALGKIVANVRAILVHFDSIGLIKYCLSRNLFYVSVPVFLARQKAAVSDPVQWTPAVVFAHHAKADAALVSVGNINTVISETVTNIQVPGVWGIVPVQDLVADSQNRSLFEGVTIEPADNDEESSRAIFNYDDRNADDNDDSC